MNELLFNMLYVRTMVKRVASGSLMNALRLDEELTGKPMSKSAIEGKAGGGGNLWYRANGGVRRGNAIWIWAGGAV